MIYGIEISLKPEDGEVKAADQPDRFYLTEKGLDKIANILNIKWDEQKSGYYRGNEEDYYILVAEYYDQGHHSITITTSLDECQEQRINDVSVVQYLREKSKRRILYKLANCRYTYSREELSHPLFFIR